MAMEIARQSDTTVPGTRGFPSLERPVPAKDGLRSWTDPGESGANLRTM